jgi:hypothetical protein
MPVLRITTMKTYQHGVNGKIGHVNNIGRIDEHTAEDQPQEGLERNLPHLESRTVNVVIEGTPDSNTPILTGNTHDSTEPKSVGEGREKDRFTHIHMEENVRDNTSGGCNSAQSNA